jgi:hypothetical protein
MAGSGIVITCRRAVAVAIRPLDAGARLFGQTSILFEQVSLSYLLLKKSYLHDIFQQEILLSKYPYHK